MNVVDEKNNISLSDFIRYSDKEILELTRINEKCSIEKNKIEKLEYVKIYDLFLYPEDLKNFLIKFPCEDRMLSLGVEGTELTSSAPGFQQTFDKHYFRRISLFMDNIMRENNLTQHSWDVKNWDYYSNCMYSGMSSYQRNNLPHVDPFYFACNMYLSDLNKTGTTFFKFVGNENEYYNIDDLHRKSKKDYTLYTKELFKSSLDTEFKLWETFVGNKYYQKYHVIDADYNSASIYKGSYWHSVIFDAKDPNQIRYSLVGTTSKKPKN
jgi:hypothetical protein